MMSVQEHDEARSGWLTFGLRQDLRLDTRPSPRALG
jgi:hypothetical protein